MRDGSVRFMSQDIDPEVMQQLQGEVRAASGPHLAADYREREWLAARWAGIGFWDWVQGGLDVGGVFEPTPFCDLASGLISAVRGNWGDAGCSALAMIPYVGDAAAKTAKYGRKAAKLANRAADATHAADNIADAAQAAAKAPASASRQFWTNSTEFQGSKVYQRNDLINPKLIDPRGRTNLERMQKGLAPIGPDGKPVNVHHMLQTQNGPLAEMTQTFHQQNTSTIHINPNTIPSGIDRPAFEAWRQQYWMNRAQGFGGGSP